MCRVTFPAQCNSFFHTAMLTCASMCAHVQGYCLLNCDDHAGFLRRHDKDPALYRPDICHQALLAILDSPLAKSGRLKVCHPFFLPSHVCSQRPVIRAACSRMIGELCIPLMSCPPTQHLSFHKGSDTCQYHCRVFSFSGHLLFEVCSRVSGTCTVPHGRAGSAQCHTVTVCTAVQVPVLVIWNIKFFDLVSLRRIPCWSYVKTVNYPPG